jgi:hypothetical protein
MSGLTSDRHELPPEIDSSRPHSARVHDYLLGGENYFEADRALADPVLQAAPHSRTVALENRQFLGRVVGPAGHPHPPGRSAHDFGQPVALTLFSVLHLLREEDKPAEIIAFTGLELIPPGVVLVSEWRDGGDGPRPGPHEVNYYGGVALKP